MMTSEIMRSELKIYKNFNGSKINFTTEQQNLYSKDKFIPVIKLLLS